jgi:DNA transposition AAA+ family ATPase
VAGICELARESQTPAFVIGPSHCGKTTALRQHVSSNNHGRSVYCRIPAASGVAGVVRVIAAAVGISDNNNEVNLRRYIKRAVTPDMLVVLDEVHQLSYTYQKSSFFKALEVIREIYDETRCGMVLCGTKLLLEKIEGAKNAELEQLFNRGTHRLNLGNSPTPADLKAILSASKLDFPNKGLELEVVPATKKSPAVVDQPYEVLRQLATTTRLKAITERLRYARKLAGKEEKPISWVHFLQAHHMIKKNEDDGGEVWS